MKYLPPLLGHIPRQIDDPRYPHLHGFPLNICFPCINWKEGAREREFDTQSYRLTYITFWPDMETFTSLWSDQGPLKGLDYFNTFGGDQWIRVLRLQEEDKWKVVFFRGQYVERVTQGKDFDQVLWHVTFGGLNYDKSMRQEVMEWRSE